MRVGRFFRHLLYWGLPLLVGVLLLITGFAYWLTATTPGTRWLINTAAVQFNGQSQGVKGSLWHGLEFEHVSLHLPNDLYVALDGAQLKIDWPQLWQQRQLKINTLEAQRVEVQVDGEATPTDPTSPPFEMPQLPVSVQLDRLAVGQVQFSQQGQSLPVDLSQLDLVAQGSLIADQASIRLQSAQVGYDEMWLKLQAQGELQPIAEPWHSQLQAQIKAFSQQDHSPICLQQYLPAHLQAAPQTKIVQTTALVQYATQAVCAVEAHLEWKGSLEQATVQAQAQGQGLSLDAQAALALDQPFPLRDTQIHLELADGSGVEALLNWAPPSTEQPFNQLSGTLTATHFDVGAWLPDTLPAAKLSTQADYSIQLSDEYQLEKAIIQLDLGSDSSWNQRPLTGHLHLDMAQLDSADLTADTELWQAYVVNNSDIDLHLGDNHIQLKGAFGLADNQLDLHIDAPSLVQAWPDLSELGPLQAEAQLVGSLFKHQLKAKAHYVLPGKEPGLGVGPVEAQLAIDGVWDDQKAAPSWKGHIQQLNIEHVQIQVATQGAIAIEAALPAPDQEWAVDIGAFNIAAHYKDHPLLALKHEHTHLADHNFSTKGQTEAIGLSAKRIERIEMALGLTPPEPQKRGGVVDKRQAPNPVEDLVLQLDWDVALKNALSGQLRLHKLSGDLIVPADPPFALGLEKTEINVDIQPRGEAGRSVALVDAQITTQSKGNITATGSVPIHYSADQGIYVREADPKELEINADIDDLAWTSLFLREQIELGGALQAQVQVRSLPDGSFESSGTVNGQHLKVVRLDDGVRLLDGELQARLDDNVVQLERLYFPARLRVEPKEWRTATWVKETPEAQNGDLLLTGRWDLMQSTGQLKVVLDHYPILQRADRYAMMSGEMTLDATLPQISLKGKVVADAGWVDLDMIGGVPTVDSDVVVIRSTDPKKTDEDEPAVPLDLTMELVVDLGPRFYLTGYGVNSGLVGQLTISMIQDRLTALGALNTRGGAVEMYGQRLLLRRGSITFQGDIDNPILDIRALRTGLSVNAGVKVGGTARKPIITLISEPEVSELEKLSWLLFGHGPDEGGGDLALLVAVGTSLLSDGEPFYRRFGIDEISLRSGELGGAGSILPVSSVASSLETELSEVEKQFLEATKVLSNGFTVSLRQALADTGTVGRVSYRLSRRLNAELSVGTVSGLALVWRWFSRD